MTQLVYDFSPVYQGLVQKHQMTDLSPTKRTVLVAHSPFIYKQRKYMSSHW